jgi:glutathione S-transferase
MKIVQQYPQKPLRPETQAEVDRIAAIWEECLKQSGGPFLFGKDPCIADAFYAPVVSRFRTYSIRVSGAAKTYCDAVWSWPALQAWVADAERETLRARFHED